MRVDAGHRHDLAPVLQLPPDNAATCGPLITSAALLRTMHGPGSSPRAELVEWMTLLARHVRSGADPGRTAPTNTGAAVPATAAISGDADVFLPPRRLAPAVRGILGIELVTVAGGGHLLTEESPDEIAALSHR